MNTPREGPSTLPLTVAQQIDAVCEQFEAAWRTGQRPDLAAFVGDLPDTARQRLVLELIQLDAFYRRQAGDTLTAADYQAQFPDLDPELIAAAAVTVSDGPSPPPPTALGVARVEGYTLGAELGRGGMGVVYQARHTELNRTVALKMIRAGEFATKAEQERFRIEAEAVARLQHPNIVQVFEVGEWTAPGGTVPTPFFALEYVAGGTLATKWNRTPQPARQAAELMEVLARAVHHAHEKGIVHRDLKPANVLLAPDGTPKVTDFGLAKRLDVEDHHTRTGALLGTPSYMSPEQASGDPKAIGPAADVWALGAILYECLTGNPPFKGESPITTLELVRTQEPVPLRRVLATVPRDLETICLKCLTKEPSKRYPSAAALAEDLRRYLDGRPIVARRTPTWERAWKFMRRRPAASGFAGAAAAAVLASLVILMTSNAQIREQRNELAKTVSERDGANAKLHNTNQDLERTNGDLDQAVKNTKAALAKEQQAVAELEWGNYVTRISLAYRAWLEGSMKKYRDELAACPPRFRQFEWHVLRRLALQPRHTFRLPTAGVPTSLAFLPNNRLAVGKPHESDGQLAVWDLESGAASAPTIQGGSGGPHFGQGGRTVYLAQGQTLLTLDTSTWAPTRSPIALAPENAVRVAVNPTGRVVVTRNREGVTQVFRANRPPLVLVREPFHGGPLAISSDGKWAAAINLATAVLTVWNSETGAERCRREDSYSECLVFSQDASRVYFSTRSNLSQHPGVVGLDASTGKVVTRFIGGQLGVESLAVSGPRLATGSWDGIVRLWDRETGLETQVFRPYLSPAFPAYQRTAYALAFGLNGRQLASAHSDGSVLVWDIGTNPEKLALAGRTDPETDDLRTPDTPPWSPTDGKAVLDFFNTRGNSHVSSDEARRLHSWGTTPDVSKGWGHDVRVQDVKTKETIHVLRGHTKGVSATAFSPDDRWVLSGSEDKSLRVWDAVTGELVRAFQAKEMVRRVAASPNRRFVAAGGNVKQVHIWNVATGAVEADFSLPDGSAGAFDFSPDDRYLAMGYGVGNIAVWDVSERKLLYTRAGHSSAIARLRYVSGGTRLVSFSSDGLVMVWDALRGEELLALPKVLAPSPVIGAKDPWSD